MSVSILGNLRGHHVLCLLHQCTRPRAKLADLCISSHRRTAHTSHRREIPHVVPDVLDLQVVEHETQALQVAVGFFDELLLKHDLFLVDLFGRQFCDDPAKVSLECIFRHVHDLILPIAEKALDRVVQQRLLAGDLDVGDGLHVERNATA